jgi:molybdopterin converting factor subunit 1
MMTVRVLYFSVLRDEIGTAEQSISLDEPARGDDLLDALADVHPAVEEHRNSLRLAVNETYVPSTVSLSDGDEVALITPVSGG